VTASFSDWTRERIVAGNRAWRLELSCGMGKGVLVLRYFDKRSRT
jgi:hypothetical protein